MRRWHLTGDLRIAGVMEVNPLFPARIASKFIAHAKSNPAKINMTSGDNWSAQHLYGGLFKMMTGIDCILRGDTDI